MAHPKRTSSRVRTITDGLPLLGSSDDGDGRFVVVVSDIRGSLRHPPGGQGAAVLSHGGGRSPRRTQPRTVAAIAVPPRDANTIRVIELLCSPYTRHSTPKTHLLWRRLEHGGAPIRERGASFRPRAVRAGAVGYRGFHAASARSSVVSAARPTGTRSGYWPMLLA
jgi:hypothetical protein